MKKEFEIYVRQSAGRNLLMLHVPEELKERFIEGLKNGSFEAQDVSIHLEMSVLEEWKDVDDHNYIRLELSEITANY